MLSYAMRGIECQMSCARDGCSQVTDGVLEDVEVGWGAMSILLTSVSFVYVGRAEEVIVATSVFGRKGLGWVARQSSK